MLRLSGLTLPLDHEAEAIAAAICVRLGIAADRLLGYEIVRRGNEQLARFQQANK